MVVSLSTLVSWFDLELLDYIFVLLGRLAPRYKGQCMLVYICIIFTHKCFTSSVEINMDFQSPVWILPWTCWPHARDSVTRQRVKALFALGFHFNVTRIIVLSSNRLQLCFRWETISNLLVHPWLIIVWMSWLLTKGSATDGPQIKSGHHPFRGACVLRMIFTFLNRWKEMIILPDIGKLYEIQVLVSIDGFIGTQPPALFGEQMHY